MLRVSQRKIYMSFALYNSFINNIFQTSAILGGGGGLHSTRVLASAVLPCDSSGFLLLLTVLLLSQLPLGSQATEASHSLLKGEGRVEDVQGEASDDDHDALKPDEQPLMPDEVSGPALTQLRDSVHASPEDADRSERQCADEALEPQAPTHLHKDRVLVEGVLTHGPVALVTPEREVHAENHKDEKRDDLDGQPGDHDVVASIGVLARVRGRGGDSTTSSLEQQGPEIAWNELVRELVRKSFCSKKGGSLQF